jgi:hypothetical protein
MLDAIRDEILAQVISGMTPDIEPDEITASMVADRTGRNVNKCKEYLDSLVADGLFTSRQVICDCRKMTAYRKV